MNIHCLLTRSAGKYSVLRTDCCRWLATFQRFACTVSDYRAYCSRSTKPQPQKTISAKMHIGWLDL